MKVHLEASWENPRLTGSSVAGPGPRGVVELTFQLEMTLPTTILIQENQGLLSIERKKKSDINYSLTHDNLL